MKLKSLLLVLKINTKLNSETIKSTLTKIKIKNHLLNLLQKKKIIMLSNQKLLQVKLIKLIEVLNF